MCAPRTAAESHERTLACRLESANRTHSYKAGRETSWGSSVPHLRALRGTAEAVASWNLVRRIAWSFRPAPGKLQCSPRWWAVSQIGFVDEIAQAHLVPIPMTACLSPPSSIQRAIVMDSRSWTARVFVLYLLRRRTLPTTAPGRRDQQLDWSPGHQRRSKTLIQLTEKRRGTYAEGKYPRSVALLSVETRDSQNPPNQLVLEQLKHGIRGPGGL